MGEVVEAGDKMTYTIASIICGATHPQIPDSHPATAYRLMDNQSNEFSPCQWYNSAIVLSDTDIIIYMHDDLTIHDPEWLSKVLMSLWGDRVAIGLGGALSLGSSNLYRKPYDIRNLARRSYGSNQDDWQTHGEHFTGIRQVAVIEQFFMAIRTDWLRSRGGWPTQHLTHHCMDMWLACEAARCHKEIWQAGISCHHAGGGSSTKPMYANAKWLQGGSMEKDHQIPHRWIYDTYRDVLPIII